MSLTNGL